MNSNPRPLPWQLWCVKPLSHPLARWKKWSISQPPDTDGSKVDIWTDIWPPALRQTKCQNKKVVPLYTTVYLAEGGETYFATAVAWMVSAHPPPPPPPGFKIPLHTLIHTHTSQWNNKKRYVIIKLFNKTIWNSKTGKTGKGILRCNFADQDLDGAD